jgi:copper(I)-binding protein
MKTARVIALLLVALLIGAGANAQTPVAQSVAVEQPWARATPKGAKTGAAYMTLVNKGATADRLVGAATAVADKVQFHQDTEDNGVSRMREIPAVELVPGAKVVFKPGEMHMMLVGLKQPLVQGQTVSLTLRFAKAGEVEIAVPVEGVGAMQHDGMGSMMRMPHDDMKK